MSWVLTPAMVRLRAEVDAIAPGRDRRSDGSIGDQSHASGVSGHNPDETGNSEYRDSDRVNEVRAIDLDQDLRRSGLSMEDVVQHLVRRCRSGAERRLAYVIYRRRIWGDGAGWREQPYSGANPHDQHCHVSGRPAGDGDTSSYHLADLVQGAQGDEEDDEMTPAEKWVQHVMNYRLEALRANRAVIKIPARADLGKAYKAFTEPNNLAVALAVLAARDEGLDQAAVLARVEQLAAAETARDEALRELVEQGVSGQLDAAAVVARMGELLAAAPAATGTA